MNDGECACVILALVLAFFTFIFWRLECGANDLKGGNDRGKS